MKMKKSLWIIIWGNPMGKESFMIFDISTEKMDIEKMKEIHSEIYFEYMGDYATTAEAIAAQNNYLYGPTNGSKEEEEEIYFPI